MYTLVNKYNYLDYSYVPDDLVTVSYEYTINDTKLNKIALENFIKMAEDAKKDGIYFIMCSSDSLYRSCLRAGTCTPILEAI